MPHNDGGMKRCDVDEDDRQHISTEHSICSHPLDTESYVHDNIQNGQVAPAIVNVSDSLGFDGTIRTALRNSQYAIEYYAKSETRCQNWEQDHVRSKVHIYPLLVVSQHWEPLSKFGYELCALHTLLMDENGWLRRGNKAILVHKLGAKYLKPSRPDVIIVDARQPLYHVAWPCGGNVSVLAESLKAWLACYAATEKILVFDRDTEISAKDNKGQRRAVFGSTTFKLDPQ